MDGKKANLIVSDLPYNVDYHGTAGTIQNDNMDDKKFYEFLLKAFQCMYEYITDGGGIYIFHADRESINFRTAFKDAGFFCHQTCIWVKNSPVLGRCDYQYCHEPILVGWKPTAGHKWYGDRKQRTVWNFDRPTKSPLHPTSKPIALIANPIKNSSKYFFKIIRDMTVVLYTYIKFSEHRFYVPQCCSSIHVGAMARWR